VSDHRAARFTPSVLTVRVRRYLYRVGLAVIVLLCGYGLLDDTRGLLWSALLAPLLALADDNAVEPPDPQAYR
jgi:hypothetical protein